MANTYSYYSAYISGLQFGLSLPPTPFSIEKYKKNSKLLKRYVYYNDFNQFQADFNTYLANHWRIQYPGPKPQPTITPLNEFALILMWIRRGFDIIDLAEHIYHISPDRIH